MLSKRKKKDFIVYVSMTKDGHFALRELLDKGKKINLIVTIKKGKAKNISDYADFSLLAKELNIPIKKVNNINSLYSYFKKNKPLVVFVNGWSQLISASILSLATYGFVGTHPSLLPKNRGRSPIAWHFINEDSCGGVTLFYLDKNCDSGPIIAQKKFQIKTGDNAKSYYRKITLLGSKLLLQHYDKIITGKVLAKKQNHKEATYLKKRNPEDSLIDFSSKAKDIHNQIRAVSGIYPTAFFYHKGEKYLVFDSSFSDSFEKISSPGKIIKISKNSLCVSTKDFPIILKKINNEKELLINCFNIFNKNEIIK